jgi:hypothetical protein
MGQDMQLLYRERELGGIKAMSDEYGQDQPYYKGEGQPDPNMNQDNLDKRIEDIRRVVVQGATEAQQRLKQAVDKASTYWQQAQTPSAPHPATSVEEQRIRQLANIWSTENWRVTRDLGNYMDLVSWSTDEVWVASTETRWEMRSMEIVTEPYAGRQVGMPQPLLPVWDYELSPVVGLKPPQTRTRLEKMNEIVGCSVCNGTGHVLCAICNGRGWVVCPDCKGRTKKKCATCRGRGYVADWVPSEKKPFLKKQAENVASSVGGKVADVFENIRQQGVPIPNPIDTDPATKGATVPCPDCVKGEVPCTCGNGKRMCSTCEGAKMSLCNNCAGTGKVVRHREIVRRFDLHSQTRVIGESPIPVQQLLKANGDLVYNAEVNEPLYADAPPDNVLPDIWKATVELVNGESQVPEKPGIDQQTVSRATLQVVELVRVPYTQVHYRVNGQDYIFYVYDSEGREKFYAERFPARWDRIERLVKAITTDLMAPTPPTNNNSGSYRVPIEVPPYNITEEDDEEKRPGQ